MIIRIFDIGEENFGMLFLGVLLIMYSYYSSRVSYDDIIYTKVTLKEEVHFGVHGGDMPYDFVELHFNEVSKSYSLMSCSYDMADLNKLEKLISGDTINLGVIRNTIESKVCYLSSNKYGSILSFDSYNSCSQNSWKYYLILLLLYMVYVLAVIYNNYRKLYSS